VINTVAFYRQLALEILNAHLNGGLDPVFELNQVMATAQEEALDVVMTTFTTRGGASVVKLAYGLN
jgi:hypothetical protein